jgi:hypothetical protein
MKTILASLITALVVAGGAGAYVSVVTPRQFNALKARVSVLESRAAASNASLSTLDAEETSLQQQLASNSNATTVECLRTQWNAYTNGYVPVDAYAVNGARYDSSLTGFPPGAVLWVGVLSTTKHC